VGRAVGLELSYNSKSHLLGAVYSTGVTGSSDIVFKTSADGGRTWSPATPIVANGGLNGGGLAVPLGIGWKIIFNEENSGDVGLTSFTPGKPIRAPISLGKGIVQSFTAHDGVLYMGMTSSLRAKFAASLDGGASWQPYNSIPVNLGDLTSNANIAVGPGGWIYAVWSDFGSGTSNSTQFRFASVSTDGGATWSTPPAQLDQLASTPTTTVQGVYFNPTAFVFNNTIADFMTKVVGTSSGATFSTSVDWWDGGSKPPQHQQIGPTGLQGGFGVVVNDSFLYANAIDSKGFLIACSGHLGGTLACAPTSVSLVQEDRVFPTNIDADGIPQGGRVHFVTEIVRNSEPGPASDIQGTVK
jgi:hypothetical protein